MRNGTAIMKRTSEEPVFCAWSVAVKTMNITMRPSLTKLAQSFNNREKVKMKISLKIDSNYIKLAYFTPLTLKHPFQVFSTAFCTATSDVFIMRPTSNVSSKAGVS
jgi:hypothetical protein